jgi:hypothetical protein
VGVERNLRSFMAQIYAYQVVDIVPEELLTVVQAAIGPVNLQTVQNLQRKYQ